MEKEEILINLLDALGDFKKKNNFAKKFNMFEALGVEHQEIRHSRFLAFLLTPSAPHGLGDRLLRSLLVAAVSNTPNSPVNRLHATLADLDNCDVYVERDNFDISVHIPILNLLFVIENKIGASEGKDQLKKYRERAENKYSKVKFLGCFLTPDGYPGEDPSWATMSHLNVLETIQQIRNDEQSLPIDSTIILDHYIDLIKRHIVISDELKNACKDIYRIHRSAIDLIIEHGRVPILHEAFEAFAENKNLINYQSNSERENFIPMSWQSISKFQVADEEKWRSSCPLVFWFRLEQDKIRLYLELGPIKEEKFNRYSFLERMQKIGYSLQKKPKETFTRIYRLEEKISDNMDSSLVKEKMSNLWSSFCAGGRLDILTAEINDFASRLPTGKD